MAVGFSLRRRQVIATKKCSLSFSLFAWRHRSSSTVCRYIDHWLLCLVTEPQFNRHADSQMEQLIYLLSFWVEIVMIPVAYVQ